MKRQGTTKEEIIKIISEERNANLSTICKKLNLAPSTVSKHLHDLEFNGIIRQKESHVKKWKYYELTPKMSAERIKRRGITVSRALIVSAVVITMLVSLLFYLTGLHYYNKANTVGVSYIPISITDPPLVPRGTQSLYINYSSLSVHVNYKNSSQWISINASGRLDLMSLINESQIIGLAAIKPNSSIDAIKFNITSASITIDNVTYGVYVPKKEVITNVSNNKVVNASSGLLIDFAPAVAVISTNNSTLFILVPSLRATVFTNPNMAYPIDSTNGLPSAYAFPLQSTFSFSRTAIGPANVFPSMPAPNIAILNSSMYLSGNDVAFDIKLKNTGTENVTVMNIQIGDKMQYTYGGAGFAISNKGTAPSGYPESVKITRVITGNQVQVSQETISYKTATLNSMYNASKNSTLKFYEQFNSSVVVNASALYAAWANSGTNSIRITLPSPVNSILISNFTGVPAPIVPNRAYMYQLASPQGINFVVNGNGTISSPLQFVMLRAKQGDMGYDLHPNSTVSLSYDGPMDVVNSGLSGDHNYSVVIFTNKGVIETNITV